MNNLSVSNWHTKWNNLSSIKSSPFLNDTSCLGFSNLSEQSANDLANIKNQRLMDPNTVMIGHLNINSFRNKYEMCAGFMEHFNVFLISESKLDDTFPDKQFRINGFKIFRCYRNRYGGGLIYVHGGIPCKPLKIPLFDLNTVEPP